MNKSDLLHYKGLLLAKPQELSAGRSLADPVSAAGESGGDPVDMAAGEISGALQMRLKQTNGKLSGAIEDALTRI